MCEGHDNMCLKPTETRGASRDRARSMCGFRPKETRSRVDAAAFTFEKQHTLRPSPGGPASRGQTSKALTKFIWLKRGDSSAGVTQALGKPAIHGDLNPASLSHLRAPQVKTLRELQSREALLLAGVPPALDRCRSYFTETIRKSKRVAP